MDRLKQTFKNLGDDFSGSEGRTESGLRDFYQSNSWIAKLAFLILVVILFVLLLRIGSAILTWLMGPVDNPKLVSCMKDAKKLMVIPQNPNIKGSKPVLRSNNQRGGLEFTWSVWLYIDDMVYKSGQRKHIFHKGNDTFNEDDSQGPTGIAYPNNGPGLYLHPTRNTLIIIMNTFDEIIEEVEVNDIPLHKWVNVAIRLRGKVMDVFINGDIVLRHIFKSVPRQNYGDVYVNMNGGYSGYLADLWYHDYSMSGIEIEQIVQSGPCLRMDKSTHPFPPYLSLRWYFQNDAAPPGDTAPYWPTQSVATE